MFTADLELLFYLTIYLSKHLDSFATKKINESATKILEFVYFACCLTIHY